MVSFWVEIRLTESWESSSPMNQLALGPTVAEDSFVQVFMGICNQRCDKPIETL